MESEMLPRPGTSVHRDKRGNRYDGTGSDVPVRDDLTGNAWIGCACGYSSARRTRRRVSRSSTGRWRQMRNNRHVLLAASVVALISLLISAAYAGDDPFDGMRIYYEGQYKVGRDFAAGEYVLLNISDLSGYFAVSSDANGRDITANGVFDVNSIITVYDGEYLELSRCIAVDSADFYSAYTIKTDQDGTMLKVGCDIMPGEYKLIAASGETGYYCIYDSSRRTDIIANDIFRNSTWVTVRYGQYLVLDRCRIQQ